jgi:hypothetical protein
MTIPRNDVCFDMDLFGTVCRCAIINALPAAMAREAKLLIVEALEDADDPEALWDAMVQGFEDGEPGKHRGITMEDLGFGADTNEDLVTITIGEKHR